MRRFSFLFCTSIVLLASCSVKEEDYSTSVQNSDIFYATIEQFTDNGTKVYASQDLRVLWNKGDHISIFNKKDANDEYRFTGETGDSGGSFELVKDFSEEGVSIDKVYAVYPYSETTSIDTKGTLTVEFPSVQYYMENSFGPGSNMMVSVSKDNNLQFKNVGGYLRISLYGEGVTVSSITLKGNNGEKLAGKVSVTMPLDRNPTAVLADDASDEITLVCDSLVELGASADESKVFWFVVPPLSFSKGFTISVNQTSGVVFEKSSSKSITIERSYLSKMSPIEVDNMEQPNNIIYYTSSDGNIVTPYASDVFGANIISNEYIDGMGIITFDGDVTIVGSRAFQDCSNLISINLPNSVNRIGYASFFRCTGLTRIKLPKGLTQIDGDAFHYCINLANISLPDGLTSISSFAFLACTSLAEITIPDSVSIIETGAFAACSSLKSFYGKYASSDGLYLSNSYYDYVSYCERRVLFAVASGSVNGSFTIPDDVDNIGGYSFGWCTNLTSVTLPEGVINIGECAFRNCTGLKTVTIPSTVKRIEMAAFYNCSGLESITVMALNPPSLSGDEEVFSGTNDCPIFVPYESIDLYKMLWYRFADRIQAMAPLPKNVIYYTSSDETIITPYAVSGFGASIISNEYKKGKGIITFDGDITSIGDNAFFNCSNLTSIAFPDNVTRIGKNAFQNCTDLSIIDLPEGVTSIESSAFLNCTSLALITLPNSVTLIDDHAFSNCVSLKGISIPSKVMRIGEYAFYNCTSLKGVSIPYSISSIQSGTFANCSSLTNISIPSSVNSIGDSAFLGCNLISLSIPEGVSSIGSKAFEANSHLTSITVLPLTPPSGGTKMFNLTNDCFIYVPQECMDAYKTAEFWREYAPRIKAFIPQPNNVIYYISSDGNIITPYSTSGFGANYVSNEYVDGRGIITFDSDITSIGDNAFINCYKLTSISIPESVKTINDGAFGACAYLSNINFPQGLTEIGEGAFFGCGLTVLTLPESLERISNSAFQSCVDLISVSIPNGKLESIGGSAFKACDSLTSISILKNDPPYLVLFYTFDYTNNCPIFIPKGCLEIYIREGWKEYASRLRAVLD